MRHACDVCGQLAQTTWVSRVKSNLCRACRSAESIEWGFRVGDDPYVLVCGSKKSALAWASDVDCVVVLRRIGAWQPFKAHEPVQPHNEYTDPTCRGQRCGPGANGDERSTEPDAKGSS